MVEVGKDSLGTRRVLNVDGALYDYYDLNLCAEKLGKDLSQLPFCLKILLENLLRFEDGLTVTPQDIDALIASAGKSPDSDYEIAYRPARVLMQDFTGVPAVVDLAAMRQAMQDMGADPKKINPLTPVDLVIDHSVMVDYFGTQNAFSQNIDIEFQRNRERYEFLRWGQEAFDNFRVVPPGTGICHQVNIEYLARVVWSAKDNQGKMLAFPDSLVGTDSHTTMANGLGILGWGVGGIEAEAAMLGQPFSMLIPQVVGFNLSGKLREGVNATDLVLRIAQMLRQKGVVAKFVEFYGEGIESLSLAERATVANMAPEYGATCGIFPVDSETINYLRLTGRSEHQLKLVEAYMKTQGMWHESGQVSAHYDDGLTLNLGDVTASLAGPTRPQDRIDLPQVAKTMRDILKNENYALPHAPKEKLDNGAVVIAAITSCTNTSNPFVLIGAGLVARKARALGLKPKPWVKTSFAPGSQVVTDYLNKAGLTEDLNALGFHLVGYGCTTCIGNSGPLPQEVSQKVDDEDLYVCAVLSGNRNFEGRISSQVRGNFLASPPLVVAYSILGTILEDITQDALGMDKQGNPVYLKDIWPGEAEIQEITNEVLSPDLFTSRYQNVFQGTEEWQQVKVSPSQLYDWQDDSTYVCLPPFFENLQKTLSARSDIINAVPLLILGDSITTDHISPAGGFRPDTPAGQYLQSQGVRPVDFNSYGSRRGNHEVMMRGTFANIRIKNKMLDNVEGGFTKYQGAQMSVYDAAMGYMKDETPLMVIAGKEYGTGSSRDWAAKGTALLGIRAVIAESFERIHRSNLVGMGVLPLQFKNDNADSLGLDGSEKFTIKGLSHLKAGQDIDVDIIRANGEVDTITVLCRIDTANEVDYFNNQGILPFVLRRLAG